MESMVRSRGNIKFKKHELNGGVWKFKVRWSLRAIRLSLLKRSLLLLVLLMILKSSGDTG